MEFVQAGGYRDRQWWRPDDWDWVESDHVAHPALWEREGDRWFWRGMFEKVPLPETLARLRDVGGGQRLCALAGPQAAD